MTEQSSAGRLPGWVPNAITGLRVLFIPVIVWLLLDPGRSASVMAGLIFFLASWSDFLDGYLARRNARITPLGKLLDPLADKLIVMASLVMLCAMHRNPRVPAWLVVLIVGREIAITGLRAIAVEKGRVLGAEELGKYKTIFQILALHGLLLHYDFLGVDFFSAGMYFLWISTAVSMWSGIAYSWKVAQLPGNSA